MPRLYSGAACDRAETNKTPKILPIPKVVSQQPLETFTDPYSLDSTTNASSIQYTTKTSRTTVASQTSQPKGIPPQNYVVATEQPSENQTGTNQYRFLTAPIIQESEQNVTTTIIGDTTIPPLTTTTPLTEEMLVRDEQTSEAYLPLNFTVVLKRKQEVLYVPLDFVNHLTTDALLDSRAYVSAFAQKYLDTIKQNAPSNIVKIDKPATFQIQVANGLLEKPLTTATLTFEFGENRIAEYFFVMKKITRPFIGLHFMGNNNSVVNDKSHGLIHSPHMTMQVKTASSEATAKHRPVISDDALK